MIVADLQCGDITIVSGDESLTTSSHCFVHTDPRYLLHQLLDVNDPTKDTYLKDVKSSRVCSFAPTHFGEDLSVLTIMSSREWAEDVSDNEANDPNAIPAPVTTVNKDGTKTTVSYKIDDSGRKVKVTRKTRTTVHREKVNPEVAERRTWAKFGLEKGKSKGPQADTTTVGENIVFRPSRDWKAVQQAEAKDGGGKAEEKSLKEQLRDKKVKCRICQGEHFTARCPYKDTMAPVGGDNEPAADPMAEDSEQAPKQGGLGQASGGYVPPHLRKGAAASAGERMGGKFERDDLATLRVTNVSCPPCKLWVIRR